MNALYSPRLATLIIAMALCLVKSYGQELNSIWAKSLGLNQNDDDFKMVSDGSGNFYITSLNNGFLNKYDGNGSVIWSKTSSSSDFTVTALCADASGNAYIAGTFTGGSVTFGTQTLNNNPSNGTNIFVVKYNTAGDVVWAIATGDGGCSSIATSSDGNIYFSGSFSSSITFGSITLIDESTALTDSKLEGFLTKLNSSGDILWAIKTTSSIAASIAIIKIDASGDIYAAGSFASSATFGTYTLNTVGSNYMSDAFLAKYTVDGDPVWAISEGTSGYDLGSALSVDNGNNAYLAAQRNQNGVTVTKYNSNGLYQWRNSSGGACTALFYDMTMDDDNNLYAAGNFWGNDVSFDTTDIDGNYGQNGNQTLLVKYNVSGEVQWAGAAKGYESSGGTALAVCSVGTDIYFVGRFNCDTLVMGGTRLLNEEGGATENFIAKIGSDNKVLSILTTGNSQLLELYPNPTAGTFRLSGLQANKEYFLKICTLQGEQVINSTVDNASVIDLSGYPKGVYTVELINATEGKATGRLILQ